VRLHFGRDVRATVLDDGSGFDASQLSGDARTANRLGPLGIRERAKLAGAALSITSRSAAGTRVAVRLRPAQLPEAPAGVTVGRR
jgi:signal transduction histidine kinase